MQLAFAASSPDSTPSWEVFPVRRNEVIFTSILFFFSGLAGNLVHLTMSVFSERDKNYNTQFFLCQK